MTLETVLPRGGVLSPVLYNILIKELTSLPTNRHARILACADDVAVVVSGPNHVTRANHLPRRVFEKCSLLGLVINRAKTRSIAVGHRCLPEPLDLAGSPGAVDEQCKLSRVYTRLAALFRTLCR